jgi:alkanesulfonate monooxygenase SsuD/methylene tetrahydromethanopterin reductase-like flavin-dependent oxidoreductase (luciferase family)
LAEQLGFDELWMGEHFSATSEPIPSPLMFLANVLVRTKHLRFGTAVINLPNHDPVVVAAEVAQFDHMSRGRFMLGIGPGGLVSDMELFNNPDVAVRQRKVIESIGMIQKIWSQDPPYELKGEFWSARIKDNIIPELGIGYMPKPYQKGGPPISTSLNSPSSSTARVAAQNGWSIISSNLIPVASVASHWTVYRQTSAEIGKPVSGENWRVARNVMIAPSDSEARDRVFAAQASNRYYFTYIREVLRRAGILNAIKPKPDMPDAEATVEAITEACVIYGSPKTALDRLVAFREQVGPFGTLLMTGLDWSGPNEVWERESMSHLANEVMPKFRQHALAQAAE